MHLTFISKIKANNILIISISAKQGKLAIYSYKQTVMHLLSHQVNFYSNVNYNLSLDLILKMKTIVDSLDSQYIK